MPDVRMLLPIAMLCGACAQSSSSEQACTLIGCESGLEVRIQPAPAGAYRVEAQAPGDSLRVFECPAGGSCAGAFFRDFMPATATIRVIVAADTTTATVTPEYRTLQPNGAACPPTCRVGSASVSIDADG